MRLSDVSDTLQTRNRVIAIGDLHGDREIFLAILMTAGLIEYAADSKTLNWVGGDTVVVCMGDTVDSKREGVVPSSDFKDKPMEKELQIDIVYFDFHARKQGGRVISILGNHDIFAESGLFAGYVKNVDKKSYSGQRKQWYTPGKGFSQMFGRTRNFIQIVEPCLFVHGSLVPEMFSLVPGKHPMDKVSYMNRTMKAYLKGETGVPGWFDTASRQGINPVESRRYAILPSDPTGRKALLREARKVTSLFPNIKYMVLGHTVVDTISREGSIICTDVALSRAFGEKSKVHAEYLEILKNIPYKVTMYTTGRIRRKKLI